MTADPFVHPHYGPWDPSIKKLAMAHPLMFRNRPPKIWSDLAPGWYQVVDQLCARIEATLSPADLRKVQLAQLKEKFGTLRIHVDYRGSHTSPAWTAVRALVVAAQEVADKTCQDCGAAGELRDASGYYLTLCDIHLATRQVSR